MEVSTAASSPLQRSVDGPELLAVGPTTTEARTIRNVPIKAPWWRILPTAWFHLVFVECFRIYTATFAWRRMIKDVNTHCAMRGFFENAAMIDDYFLNLYFFAKTDALNLTLQNVSDPFFLQDGLYVEYNRLSLFLPATNIPGSSLAWFAVAWILPAAAGVLLLCIMLFAFQRKVWSFDTGAYLQFTSDLTRKGWYQACVGIMALAPIVLPVLWVVQILMFNLEDQLSVFKGNALSGLLLLWSLSGMARPESGSHNWKGSPEFMNLTFKRPCLHLIMGSNSRFVLKLSNALWCARYGDMRRLERYLLDGSQAEAVLNICEAAQRKEIENSRTRSSRQQGSSERWSFR